MSQKEKETSQEQSAPVATGRRLHGFAFVSVLAALMLTLLLEALDQTIVGTALPRIVSTLQGFDLYTWVVTAYLLASTTMIPIVGKLSDQFGRKWFLVVGVVIFLAGSFLSGTAQTMDQMIAFRAIQGAGAGIGIALVFTVVGDIFSPAERAKWQGIFSAVYGLASVAGPTLGGWLTDHGPLLGNFVTDATRWRWVFYVNLPVGVIALAALLVYLPTNISARSNQYRGWAALKRVDFAGALLASAATICLLLGLNWGSDSTYAWSSPQIVSVLIAAGILYILFFIVERFAAEPLLPLHLFRIQVFAADSGVALLLGMVLLPLVIYLPLYLQGVLGESATNSGEVITPMTISLTIGSALAGFLISKVGRYQGVTIFGVVLLSFGVFLMSRMDASTTLLQASGCMVVAGVGLGTFFAVQTLAAQNAVPRKMMGVATGVIRYVSALGQTLGVAIVGTVVNNTISSELVKRVPSSTITQLTPAGWQAATNTQILINSDYKNTVVRTAQQIAGKAAVAKATAHIPPGAQHDAIAHQVLTATMQQVGQMLNQVFDALKGSMMLAIQRGFVVVLIFCGAAFISALFLKDLPLAKTFHEQKPDEKERKTESMVTPAL
jgi:MFS family permease